MKKHLLTIVILFTAVLLKAQSPDGAANNTLVANMKTDTIPPSFPGGNDAWSSFLGHHMRYPEISRKNNVQGIVLVQFDVEEDGSLTNLKVLASPSDDLSKASMKAFANPPKWNPATKDGKTVKATVKTPITFTLGPPIFVIRPSLRNSY